MRGNFKINKEDLKMKVDSKEFFSQLDEEILKKVSKKEKEEKKKPMVIFPVLWHLLFYLELLFHVLESYSCPRLLPF